MSATILVPPHLAIGQPPGPPPHTADPASSGGGYILLTVRLTASAHEALLATAQATGHTGTEVVNRALRVYQLVEDLLREDGGHLRLWHRDGYVETISIG